MDDKKDFTVELSDQVKKQIADDPEVAAALREFAAIFRQAEAGVRSGQYKTIDDAMEILTGARPVKTDPLSGEAIDGALLQDDLDRFQNMELNGIFLSSAAKTKN